MEHYVCGFMFNQERNKLRPKWQFRKLNGVGGHIEENESLEDAMSREFFEEAGIPDTKWVRVLEYSVFSEDKQIAVVYFFKSFGNLEMVTSKTDEEIIICDVDKVNSLNVLQKIKFLVQLCLNDDIWIPIHMSGARDH